MSIQPWRYNQSTRVNLFNFCLLTSEICSICDSPVSNVEIGNFIPFIRGIDHASVANKAHSCLGSTRVSRVGERVLAIADFSLKLTSPNMLTQRQSSFRRDAETSTRDACAPQNRAPQNAHVAIPPHK